jgi:hypothetical protein
VVDSSGNVITRDFGTHCDDKYFAPWSRYLRNRRMAFDHAAVRSYDLRVVAGLPLGVGLDRVYTVDGTLIRPATPPPPPGWANVCSQCQKFLDGRLEGTSDCRVLELRETCLPCRLERRNHRNTRQFMQCRSDYSSGSSDSLSSLFSETDFWTVSDCY